MKLMQQGLAMLVIRLFTATMFLAASLNAHATSNAQLELNKPITAKLTESSSHEYEIELEAKHFVYAELNQIDFDGKVTVFDPTGAVVNVFDYMARGPDAVEFDSKVSGSYTFKVEGYKGEYGQYQLELQIVEPIATNPEKRLTQLLTSFSGDGTPGAIIAIVEDGKVSHQQAVGMSSLVYSVPFTRQTISNIGSVSKQFTAFAVVELAHEGLLSLDDDVRKYFPTLPDLGHVVTIRNLLNHTNGYREYMNMLYMSGRRIGDGDFIDRKEVMRILENQPVLQEAPGTRYNYNNTAYSLAAMLVEKVSGQPFQDWLRDNIFEPLDMNSTLQRSHTGEIIPGAAEGYSGSKEAPYRISVDIGGGGGAIMGPGGIYSTVDDLAHWMGNLTTGKVGGKAIIKQLMEPNIAEPGENIYYGLGLGISNYKGLELISHQGADIAHRSMFWYLPELNSGIIAMSNNARFNPYLVQDVADVFFAEHLEAGSLNENQATTSHAHSNSDPSNFNHEQYQKFDGQYELVGYPGIMIFFWSEPEGIFTMRPGGEPQPVAPISDSSFQVNANTVYQFNSKDDGKVDSLTILDGSNIMAKKLMHWEPEVAQLPEFTGHYYSEELSTFYKIVLENDSLVIKHPRIDDMTLIPKTTDRFSANDAISEARFVRNDKGQITGFMASDIRTLNVWFKKQNKF